MQIGPLHERLLIQTNTPAAVSVLSVTRVNTTATATTAVAHGYTSGDYVTMAGASLAGYNGKVKITVTGPSEFTYAVADTLATPAVGTLTSTYATNAQGGVLAPWRTLDTVWAELVPIRALERLQARAVQATVEYRFRARARVDVTPKMRAIWTPSYPSGGAAKTLEISGVLPLEDGRTWMWIEAGEVAA